jgi:hypothetical protein
VNDLGDAVDVSPGNNVCETGTGNGICTLRAAIDESNFHGGSDTIGISVTGTIVLSGSLNIFAGPLAITGPGASSLMVSGNNTVTVMLINSSDVVSLTGVTIANGRGHRFYWRDPSQRRRNLNLNSADVYSNTAPFNGDSELRNLKHKRRQCL